MKDFELYHPYTRYGYAVALYENSISDDPIANVEDITIEELRKILIDTIESGLSNFRYHTANNPEIDEVLVFEPIGLSELRKNPDLVQSAGLSKKGIYLAPHILSTDGDAKGTFNKGEEIIKALRDGDKLFGKINASRSFAPTTAKINNGKSSQSPPKITLLEAACSLISTITRRKPSFLLIGDMQYTGIIPDLPIRELLDFIRIFSEMYKAQMGTDGTMSAKVNGDFKRPRLYDGNYPYAPYDNSAFGALGIIAAIGKIAEKSENIEKYIDVLLSITGNDSKPPAPLYIVSNNKISQAHYGHHIAQLAIGKDVGQKLCDIVLSLTRDTVLYSEIDSTSAKYDNQNYKLFNMMTNRFLQQFNSSAFQDFLAFRAEYSKIIQPLFDRYFMSEEQIPQEIVTSARAFGQWLNRAAYKAAVKTFKKDKEKISPKDLKEKIRKEKAKILTEFETTIKSSKNNLELLANISIRAGRYLQSDVPLEAAEFFDAVASNNNNLDIVKAQNLMIAYSRLSTKGEKKQVETENNQAEEENNQLETQEN